jgi:hypothetical protein
MYDRVRREPGYGVKIEVYPFEHVDSILKRCDVLATGPTLHSPLHR